MNLFTPRQCVENYLEAGRAKTQMPALKMFLLAILAGFFIAMAGAVTNTAAHTIESAGLGRMVCGLLFPFGLAMVILSGAELFTGNTLLIIPLLGRRATMRGILRNWGIVYLGNAVGALLTAAGCAFFGQLNISGGQLALFSMKLAAAKCALSPVGALVLGIFCNLLVTAGVLFSLSAQDLAGRVLGAYLPVAFFVTCGFEHSIANLFYVPVGLFARMVPGYAVLAAEVGIDLTALSWGGFLWHNLLPVTAGNVIGGLMMGALYWYCHGRRQG